MSSNANNVKQKKKKKKEISEKCVSSAGDDFEYENQKQEVVRVKNNDKKKRLEIQFPTYKTDFFFYKS